MNNTQPLLFDVPSIAETGVWCQLADGVDPAEWAGLCRQIGQLSPKSFAELREYLSNRSKPSIKHNPDSLFSRLKRIFSFNQAEVTHLPLVSLGYERIHVQANVLGLYILRLCGSYTL